MFHACRLRNSSDRRPFARVSFLPSGVNQSVDGRPFTDENKYFSQLTPGSSDVQNTQSSLSTDNVHITNLVTLQHVTNLGA